MYPSIHRESRLRARFLFVPDMCLTKRIVGLLKLAEKVFLLESLFNYSQSGQIFLALIINKESAFPKGI
jgi:hypothetical protein